LDVPRQRHTEASKTAYHGFAFSSAARAFTSRLLSPRLQPRAFSVLQPTTLSDATTSFWPDGLSTHPCGFASPSPSPFTHPLLDPTNSPERNPEADDSRHRRTIPDYVSVILPPSGLSNFPLLATNNQLNSLCHQKQNFLSFFFPPQGPVRY